jgi:hypothetical protein
MAEQQRRLVIEAIAKLKKLAARELVSKEAFQKEAEATEKRLRKVKADLDTVLDTDEDHLAQELIKIKGELEADLESKLQNFALADEQEKAESRAVVSAAVSADPFSTDPTDVALENVRGHLAELDARVKLDRELGGGDREERRRLADLEKQTSELQAREELARLKAERKRAQAQAEPEEDAGEENPGSGSSSGSSKRSM